MFKKILVISGAVLLSTMLLSGCIKKKPKPVQKLPETSVATISDLATPSELDSNEQVQTIATTEATTAQTIATTTAAPTTAAPKTNPAGITMAEYSKLKDGMSYQQVVNIIGGSGECATESSSGGITIKIYTWRGEINPDGLASLSFKNGKLMVKTQIGL